MANRRTRANFWRGPTLLTAAVTLAGCLGEITRPGEAGSESAAPPGTTPIATNAALGEAQLRLLSAVEYKNTVHDLLGIDAAESLSHADLGAGYDSGASGQLDENLFTALVDEAERLAAVYVADRIQADFSCFDPAAVESDCISTIIDELGRRAYRRPLSSEEHSELVAFHQGVATETGDDLKATETLVARLLSSLHFLYRSELGKKNGKQIVLDQYERASLLSYALTGSMPDDELFAAAEAGSLEGDGIRKQVRRLLNTAAGKARLAQFFRQWLRVQELDTMAADPEAFPKLESAAQAGALRDEFDSFVLDVVFDGQGTLPALLTESHTFVNQHTAALYGESASGEELSRVELDPAKRKGILSLASVMAVHSSVGDLDKDRPVVRGLLIKNQLLCEEVGLPSGINTAEAAMNVSAETPNFDELTTREQFEAMMNQGAECKNCHQQFMPYGFLLGNYDALGRFQTMKGDRPIEVSVAGLALDDATTTFPDFVSFADALAESEIAPRCFTKNYLAYTVGTIKGEHVDDLSSLLGESFVEQGQDVQQLIEDALSRPELYVKAGE